MSDKLRLAFARIILLGQEDNPILLDSFYFEFNKEGNTLGGNFKDPQEGTRVVGGQIHCSAPLSAADVVLDWIINKATRDGQIEVSGNTRIIKFKSASCKNYREVYMLNESHSMQMNFTIQPQKLKIGMKDIDIIGLSQGRYPGDK